MMHKAHHALDPAPGRLARLAPKALDVRQLGHSVDGARRLRRAGQLEHPEVLPHHGHGHVEDGDPVELPLQAARVGVASRSLPRKVQISAGSPCSVSGIGA